MLSKTTNALQVLLIHVINEIHIIMLLLQIISMHYYINTEL